MFKTRVRDETVPGPNPYRWQNVGTVELFKGKRVVVISLPGAFTPTCSISRMTRCANSAATRNPYGETDPQRILDYLKSVPSRLAA